MLYRPGDILFFTAPPQPNSFTKWFMGRQRLLSCLLFSCCTEDYKKTHVAVCTAVSEDKSGGQEVTIAHLGGKTRQYAQDKLTDLSAVLRDRRTDILRPRNPAFAEALVAIVTSEEVKKIQCGADSVERSLSCCSCTDIEKTKSGFSLSSHCSRFIAEGIDITSRNLKSDYSDYAFNGHNVTVMRLWQRLSATKLYEHITQQRSQELNSTIVNTLSGIHAPLLRAQ